MTLGADARDRGDGTSLPRRRRDCRGGHLPWSAGLRPRLTVIAQPGREMGREAARLLLDRIGKRRTGAPVRWMLPTRLHMRESCGVGHRG